MNELVNELMNELYSHNIIKVTTKHDPNSGRMSAKPNKGDR